MTDNCMSLLKKGDNYMQKVFGIEEYCNRGLRMERNLVITSKE
jgi:hypothetical protein